MSLGAASLKISIRLEEVPDNENHDFPGMPPVQTDEIELLWDSEKGFTFKAEGNAAGKFRLEGSGRASLMSLEEFIKNSILQFVEGRVHAVIHAEAKD